MKIAIVQETVDPRRGGAETSTLEMASQLAALGGAVSVLHAADEGGATPSDVARAHGAIEFCPIVTGGHSKVGRAKAFVAGVDALLRERRFEIVHAVSPCMRCDVYQPRGGTYGETIRRTLALVGSPWIRAVKAVGRQFNLRQQYLLRVERALIGGTRPPVVACVSDYVRRQVMRDYPSVAADRLRVVFNGVTVEPMSADERRQRDAATREKLGIGLDVPIVLFVAHHFKLKGLRELIAAAGIDPLRRSGAMVLVAGRDQPAAYERQALASNVSGHVRFIGTGYAVRDLLAAANVLAHPTWYDPCSRVVLEALSLGTPVVTTRWNGAADAIEPAFGRVVDEPDDVDGLSVGLTEMLAPAAREAAIAASERMHDGLSMRRHAVELASLYEEILCNRARR